MDFPYRLRFVVGSSLTHNRELQIVFVPTVNVAAAVAKKCSVDQSADIKVGQLVQSLEDFTPPTVSIQMIYPSGQAMEKRIRTLIDFLVERPTA